MVRTYFSVVTSCFCSSPSWFRSSRLKISPVLRESSGWFDSSCPGLDVVVWLSISPLSWASCTTTRHSSSDRKPGISDKNRGTKTEANSTPDLQCVRLIDYAKTTQNVANSLGLLLINWSVMRIHKSTCEEDNDWFDKHRQTETFPFQLQIHSSNIFMHVYTIIF